MSIDSIGDGAARALAGTSTRRSFLARLGLGSLVLVGGVSAAELLGASPAEASVCFDQTPGCATVTGESVVCNAFGATGSTCPTGLCESGSWTQCSGCGGHLKKFRDCAGSNTSCHCVAWNGQQYASSCFHPPYGNCSGGACVKCRLIFCSKTAC